MAEQLDIIVRTQDETTVRLKSIESSIIRFVGAVSAALSTLTVTIFPIREAAELQKELLNVAKTTNFTEVQIANLSRGLTELSTRIDLTAVELAKIAAIGGQLGLGGEGVAGIQQFTETTARFASVINVAVEEAGNGIAKLLNIFKVNVKEAERVSSLLNEISNNSTASGKDLLDIINRIGTAGGALNIKQAAALAALGKDLGLTSETVGTSFQKVFLNLQTESAELAKVIGIPVETFSNIVKKDGIEALKLALNAVRRLDQGIQAAFAEKVFGGGKIFGLVTNLLNDKDFKLLDRNLDSAERGYEGGTSAIEEQARVSQGLGYQIKLLANNFRNLAVEIGQTAIPYLTDLTKSMQEALKDPAILDNLLEIGRALGNMGRSIIEAVRFLSQFSGAFGPLLRLLQVFIGFKIASVFFNMGAGLRSMAVEALNAARAFVQLSRGQTVAVTTVKKGAEAAKETADAVRLSPLTASVGQALGAPARAVNAATAEVIKAQNVLFKAQVDLATEKIFKDSQILVAQQNINRAVAEEAALVARANALRALPARQRTESLATLRGEIIAKRALITQETTYLAQLQAEGVLLRQNGAIAIANATAAVNTAKAAVPSLLAATTASVLSTTRNVLSGIIGIIAGAAKLLINPWVILGVTIASIIGSFVGFEKVFDFFARLIGFSGTAAQKAEQDRRIAERAARVEAERIAQLADEYQKLKSIIEGVRDADPQKIAQTGGLPEFLQQLTKYVDVVEAKIKTTNGLVSDLAGRSESVRQEIESLNGSIREQERILQERQIRLANSKAYAAAIGHDITTDAFVKSGEEIEALQRKIEGMRARVEILGKSENSVAVQRIEHIQALDELYSSLGTLYSRIGEFVGADAEGTQAILTKAQAVAKQREEVQALQEQVKKAKTQAEADPADRGRQVEVARLELARDTATDALRTLNSEYRQLVVTSGAVAQSFADAVGDPLSTASAKYEAIAKQISQAFSVSAEVFENRITEAEQALTRLSKEIEKKTANISAKRQRGFFSTEVDEEELRALVKKREEAARSLELSRQQLEIAKQTRAAALSGTVSNARTRESQIAAGLAAGALIDRLREARVAQRQITEAARQTAAIYKTEYDQAVSAATEAVKRLANTSLEMQVKLRNSVASLELEQFQQRQQRGQKDFGDTIGYVNSQLQEQAAQSQRANETDVQLHFRLLTTLERIGHEYDRHITALGIVGERATDMRVAMRSYLANVKSVVTGAAERGAPVNSALLDLAQRKAQESMEEIKKKTDEINLKREQFAQIETRMAEIYGTMVRDLTQIRTLTEQEQKAREAGQAGNAAALRDQIEQSQRRLKIARDTVVELERQTEAAASGNIVSGEFFGSKEAVPFSQIQQTLTRLRQLNVDASGAVQGGAKVLAEASEESVKRASAAFATIDTQLKKAQESLTTISTNTGIAAQAFLDAGKTINTSLEGTTASVRLLANAIEQYKRQVIERTVNAPDIQNLQHLLERNAIAVQKESSERAAQISGFLVDGFRLTEAFKQIFNVTFTENSIAKRVEDAINKSQKVLNNFIFPTLKDEAQKALNTLPPLEINAIVKPTTSGGSVVPGVRSGGYVRGPGTGTSDSINARLSHGEYVMDAFSTRMLGPRFFAFLQSIAKRGGGAARSFVSTFGTIPLPSFRTGGLASVGRGFAEGGFADSAVAPIGVVAIELSAGGKKARVFGSRDDAHDLVNALRRVGYGTQG